MDDVGGCQSSLHAWGWLGLLSYLPVLSWGAPPAQRHSVTAPVLGLPVQLDGPQNWSLVWRILLVLIS